PLLIALDGPSGSGKSTLAGLVAETLDATVVPSDDFFAAEITDAEWGMRSPRDRAATALDWRRQRGEALESLLAGRSAQWHGIGGGTMPRPTTSHMFVHRRRSTWLYRLHDGSGLAEDYERRHSRTTA